MHSKQKLKNCGRNEMSELIERLLAEETDLTDCAADRIEQLEAKLAKAMEALRDTTQMLSQCTFTIIRMKGQYFERLELVDKARAVLAELEGKE
jgi:chromosome condensin MukBEF ATPase and DNA-binding subunit MukB